MTRRKSNISAWCVLALSVVLTVGCLAVSVGTAFARYREDVNGEVSLRVREPAQVYLWSGSDPSSEYTSGVGSWVENNGDRELNFMVTNVGSNGQIPDATQEFYLRMVASLGAWDGQSQLTVRLTWTREETSESVEATITRIEPDTPLYKNFGEGWLFTFRDKKDRELLWELEGDTRSTISMQLTMENGEPVDSSLFLLQVTGNMATD